MAGDSGKRAGGRRSRRAKPTADDGYDQRPAASGYDGGYAGPGGRGRPGDYQAQGGYGSAGEPGQAPGYGESGYYGSGGYGGQAGYGEPAGYSGLGGYGESGAYGDLAGYGDQPGTAYQSGGTGYGGYSDGGYDTASGHGDVSGLGNGYGPAGYPAGGHGTGDYGTGEYGPGGYGAGGGSGPRAGDPYGADGYERGGYEQAGYGQGGYGASGDYGGGPGGYVSGGYEQGGYEQGGYGQGGGGAGDPYGPGGYEPGGYAQGGYEQGGYERGGYQPGSYEAGGYEAGGYEPGGYEPGDHGQRGYQPGGAEQVGYGASGGYGAESGYGTGDHGSGGYGQPGGYGEPYGSGPHDGYGERDSRGRHAGGAAPRAGAPDSTDPYGTARGYGAGAAGDLGRNTSRADDPYADLYRERGPLAIQGPASRDPGSSLPESGPLSRPDTGSFDAAGSGTSSWAFRPGAASRGPAAAGDPANGSLPQAESGAFGRPDTGSFAADSGVFGRPDTGSFAADSGVFGRPDTGSFAADSGVFGRPDTGSFRAQDHGISRRYDTGSFAARDSGFFGRPDTGDSDALSGSDDSNLGDTGSIRWTAGPPPAKTRSDRNQEDAGLAGPLSAEPDGYADWHHDPADEDWQDDAARGLLARRFGGGGEPPADERDGGRGRKRVRKRRRVRGKAAFTIAIVAVLLVIGAGGLFGYRYAHRFILDRYGDYKGAGYGTVTVIVQEGATLAGLGPTLVRQGVIMAERPYDTAAAAASCSDCLQPGVYKLHHHMNAALAVKYLLSAKARTTDQITIIEGTRATDIAKAYARRTGIKYAIFMNLIDHPPAALGLPSWAAGHTAEGFLFPDTYTLAPHETALQILQAMVSNFKQKIASISLESAAGLVNTTPWHVLIVASMVQAESGPGDFGKVARVAWNRLTAKMALHFDSTVFYGLGIEPPPSAAASAAQIKKDTPYNTYIHAGLPPGPIGNPGLDAIKAALHPPHGTWLYFITDVRAKPSKTYFTASYAQFRKWQQEFQG